MSSCRELHDIAGRKPADSGRNPLSPRACCQPQCLFSQIYWADWFYFNLQVLDQLGAVEMFKWRSRLGERGFWRIIHSVETLSKPPLWDCSFTCIPFTQLLSTDDNSQYFCMIIMCQTLSLAFYAHYCMESSQPPSFIQVKYCYYLYLTDEKTRARRN